MMTDDEKQNDSGTPPQPDTPAESAAEPTAAASADAPREPTLEELEEKIRSQLKELIGEAKRCRDKAVDLLNRAEPFQVVRQALRRVLDDEHPHIRTLHSEHSRVVGQRVVRIRQVSSDLAQDVDLRRTAVEGQQQGWNNLEQTNGAAAARWTRAIGERRADMQQETTDSHAWLTQAERRWVDEAPVEIEDI